MSFLKWIDSYSVGVKEMDAQHKQLIELIEQLNEAMKLGAGAEVTEKIISGLIGRMVAHFSAEEQLMQSHAYPGLSDHHHMHAEMAAKLKTLNSQYKTLSDALTPELMTFLRTWLISHIQREDHAYGRYIAGH